MLCEKMDEAQAHVHEAARPCSETDEDYEALNTLELLACQALLDQTSSSDKPDCLTAMEEKADCMLEIQACDPANKAKFDAALKACDELAFDRC